VCISSSGAITADNEQAACDRAPSLTGPGRAPRGRPVDPLPSGCCRSGSHPGRHRHRIPFVRVARVK
jgi:hypothetical protein